MRVAWPVLLLFATTSAGVGAVEIQTIYVVPFTHNDVGFDATPKQMAANSVKSIDDAIEQAATDLRYVWNIETFWQLRHWLDAGRNPDPLLKLLREGRFGLNSAYICPHTSAMKAWLLDQLFRLPVQWGREHDLVLDWAMINDVPGHPPGLPRFLAVNGVKYLALGTNQSLSKRLPDEVSNTPFWWETLDGKHRVLTFICAESYAGAYMKYGIDPPATPDAMPSIGGWGGIQLFALEDVRVRQECRSSCCVCCNRVGIGSRYSTSNAATNASFKPLSAYVE